MKNSEVESENAVIVNGVILTAKAIDFLKQLQGDDNSYLKEARYELNDAISKLIIDTDNFRTEDSKERIESIKYLTIFNRSLKELMKP